MQSSKEYIDQYLVTDITRMFGIKHPIVQAGMNVAAGPELAAAVTNAGGLGVIGGLNYTPSMLREMIQELKDLLHDKKAPFGVDLLLPKVGEGARKTNYDYTKGQLADLIDVIIEEETKLFVSAVGVPPKWVIEKLHNHGILVANMVGKPSHAKKASSLGVDIICAQGSSGGGHTGDIDTVVLIPAVVDICKPLGIPVLAAGGIYDGRGLAAMLSLGASGVWVGTRFVACEEANAPPIHKSAILETNHDETFRTLVFTGRPLRIGPNEYAKDWESKRRNKMEKLLSEGKIPCEYDLEAKEKGNFDAEDIECLFKFANKPTLPYPHLMGQTAGSIQDIKTAKEIVEDMVLNSINILNKVNKNRIDYINKSKL